MLNRFIFILVLPFFFSCYHENQPEATVPQHLINKDELVQILVDIQLAEGALSYRRARRIEQQDFRKSVYQKIFSVHGINAKILNENINYYNSEPENMELIYEAVLAKLSRMEGELNEEAKQESIQSDTLNK